VLLAWIPPTLAAAMIAASGRSAARKAPTALVARQVELLAGAEHELDARLASLKRRTSAAPTIPCGRR
jgi:hypothetical protein